MQEASDRAFGVEVSKGVLGKFVMAAIGFGGTIVFARLLGPAGYGAFALFITLVNLSDNPITGWAEACKKRMSETDFPKREAVGSAMLGVLFSAAPAFLAAFLFQGQIAAYTGIDNSWKYAVLLYIFLSFFSVSNILLLSTGRVGATIWIDTLRSVFTLPSQLVLVLTGAGVIGMIYGEILATALTIPIVLYQLSVWPKFPAISTFKSLWSYAKFSIPAGFLSSAYLRVDLLLVGALLTPAAAGQYKVVINLTLPAILVVDAIGSGLFPRISNLISKSEPVEEDITNAISFASILSIPMFFGAAAIPVHTVVSTYGPQYQEAAVLLIAIAFYRLLMSQTRVYGAVVGAMDRPEIITLTSFFTLVVNLILGYILLLRLDDPIGIAIASVCAEAIQYLILSTTVKREFSGIGLIPSAFIHQLGAGILMYAAVSFMENAIMVRSWKQFGLLLAAGGIVYFGSLVAISPPFRQTVSGVGRDLLK